MMRSLYIIGAGGHALSVAEIGLAMGFHVRAFVDAIQPLRTIGGTPVIRDLSEVEVKTSDLLAIALGSNVIRQQLWEKLASHFPLAKFPALIHPSASVARTAIIGSGCTVHQGAVIGSNVELGNFCTINTLASVDHECRMGDFSTVAPGVNLGGKVTLGSRSFIGIGSTVVPGVQVGDDAVLGAGSLALQDLPESTVWFGSPAVQKRERSAHDKHL